MVIHVNKIRIKAAPSDQHALIGLGVYVGQYAHLMGYFEAVATGEALSKLISHGWEYSE